MLPTSAHYRTLQSLRTFTTALSHCRQLASTTTTKDFSEIPGPFCLPLAGNIHLYKLGIYNIFEYHKVLEQLYTTYGPVARQRIGTRTIVHVFNPDDVKTVHSVEGKIPEVPPLQETTQLYRKKRNFSLGLGNTNGEEWYRLRKAVQQMMLRPKEVYHYLPLVDSVAKALVEKIRNKLDENNVLDNLQDVVAKWSMESSAMVCFERRLGCLDTNERFAEQMIQANRDIFIIGGILKFSLPLFKYISTPKWNKFIAAEDFFYTNATKFANETIDEINELRKSGQLDESKYNFMSYLLSKQELSRKDVTIITLSLFADGLSTTSPSLVFNLYCLARNPDVQEEVREEIIKNIPAHGSLSLEAINNLQLLKAAVKETFRLHPIGTETSRITGNDIVLSNYRIPAGTHVDLNQFVHFRSPAYFPQPDKFQPERWVRESQMGKNNSQGMHPYLLIPFGHGTRMCAGRRFAEQDLYTSIARILQSFRVELADKDYIMDQQYQTLMVPKRPLSLRFIPRN